MSYLPCVQVQTNAQIPVQAVVIWLHGLGSNGNDFAPIVNELNLPTEGNIRFVFPHAPEMPITVNGGYVMPAWYDILEMNLNRKIDEVQLRKSAQQIQALIDREIARGVASENILIVGFSQGGAVAYEVALTYSLPLAGVLALSTYFATSQSIAPNDANKNISILIQHGSQDTIVPEVLGQRAFQALTDRGYAVDIESYVMGHTVCSEQIISLSLWLQKRLRLIS